MLLIHGARSVLCHAKTTTAPPPDRLRAWALQVERLRGHNKGRRRAGQQAGADCLGGVAARDDYMGTPAL